MRASSFASGLALRLLRVAVAASLFSLPARAHDFWLQPSPGTPGIGAKVAIHTFVGQELSGDDLGRNPTKIERFFARAPDGAEVPILGTDGVAPAGWLRADAAGLYVCGYRSLQSAVELEAAKFEQYLREEGLERVIAERSARGESAKPGRERYSRCAKALLAVGTGERGGCERRLGFPLELVAASDPIDAAEKSEVVFVLTHDGAPLADALVGCRSEGQAGEQAEGQVGRPADEVRLRTDARGEVRFPMTGTGFHLVRVVHMVRAPEGSDHEWESLWASLSFTRPVSR